MMRNWVNDVQNPTCHMRIVSTTILNITKFFVKGGGKYVKKIGAWRECKSINARRDEMKNKKYKNGAIFVS